MEPNKITLEQRREFSEVVGLFDSMDNLQSAIDDLLTHGFDRSEISLLAEDATAREKVGAKRSVEIEDSDEAPRISYIENESLNEGKASLIGLLFYVGAIVGSHLGLRISESESEKPSNVRIWLADILTFDGFPSRLELRDGLSRTGARMPFSRVGSCHPAQL